VFKVITDAGLKCGMTLRPTKLTRNPLWNTTLPADCPPFKYFQKQLTFGGYIPNGYSGKVPLGSANWTADVKTTADIIIHKAKCKRIELRAHACCQSEQPRHVRRIQSLGMRHVLRKSGFPFRLFRRTPVNPKHCDQVDSMAYDAVQPDPGFKHWLIMPSEIWRLVHAALPHMLFIPEQIQFDACKTTIHILYCVHACR